MRPPGLETHILSDSWIQVISADQYLMAGAPIPRITRHSLAPEEASSLAWMLELAAHHCWMVGHTESAVSLEGTSVSFRIAGAHAAEYEVAISDGAIEDLTTIVWDLLDSIADDRDLIAEVAEQEWAQIAAGLVTRDQTGGAFTQFVMECPRPEDLPAFAARVVSGLRSKAQIEVSL